ncbi:antitoxin Xre/MbcA/ParS toxin-binding domain-containing protein [Afipia massiliensis]|uniref:antitoxin Xre/MbcA/ParS toxin-binding domain-containing protein n=1 Tax=Afipia massiliensis TaxID=211460 RepID=UPI003221C97B
MSKLRLAHQAMPKPGNDRRKFAEILAAATSVFGSKEAAERWLEQPAIGLNQRRPIDLLATPAGVELVEDLLVRLQHGVHT